MTPLADRAVGCVLGLALGEAAGAHPSGSTADATAMARNLVRSLGAQARLDPDDLVQRHLAWFRSGPPDVGTVTRLVLERAARGEPAPEAARAVWIQRGPEVSAGNGSVMYCAPLGVAYANRPDELFELAPLLSSITHHDERCATACLAVTLVAAAVVRGDAPEGSLREAVTSFLDREGGEELEYLIEVAGSVRPVDGPDQGFCLFTAALGLQSVLRGDDYQDGVRRVVALGGDTDTNAAVTGALLGARDGASALPEGWLERLQDRDEIEREAEGLAELAKRRP